MLLFCKYYFCRSTAFLQNDQLFGGLGDHFAAFFPQNHHTNATKPATLETGAEIKVPLFIEPGEKVKIDTRTGEYLSRA